MGKLDWGSWVYGLAYAFVAAGASSINTALGAMVADPEHFNVADPRKLYTLMAWSFILPGAIAFFAKLSQSPLPPVETITTTKTITSQENPPAVVVQTVERKETEAKS